jgi:hypothetical protein
MIAIDMRDLCKALSLTRMCQLFELFFILERLEDSAKNLKIRTRWKNHVLNCLFVYARLPLLLFLSLLWFEEFFCHIIITKKLAALLFAL